MLKYSKERNNLFQDGVQIDKDINDLRIFKVGTVSLSLIVLIRGNILVNFFVQGYEGPDMQHVLFQTKMFLL
jgi:hypothetical protein